MTAVENIELLKLDNHEFKNKAKNFSPKQKEVKLN